jgi:hypothetical protein
MFAVVRGAEKRFTCFLREVPETTLLVCFQRLLNSTFNRLSAFCLFSSVLLTFLAPCFAPDAQPWKDRLNRTVTKQFLSATAPNYAIFCLDGSNRLSRVNRLLLGFMSCVVQADMLSLCLKHRC